MCIHLILLLFITAQWCYWGCMVNGLVFQPNPSKKLGSCWCGVTSASPRAYFLIWFWQLTYRCCCHTTDVLHGEQGHSANYLYLPPPYLKTAVTLCILKPHLYIFPWIWPTRIFIVAQLQACDVFPFKYPRRFQGESVGQKELPGWSLVPVVLVINENSPNYFVLFSLYLWFKFCHIPTLNWTQIGDCSCPLGKEAVSVTQDLR